MRWIIPLVVAIAVALGLLACFQGAALTQEARPRVELSGAIDFEKLFAGITAETVGRTHRRIVRPATRLPGSDGDLEASRYVEEEYPTGLIFVATYLPLHL